MASETWIRGECESCKRQVFLLFSLGGYFHGIAYEKSSYPLVAHICSEQSTSDTPNE